MNNIIRKNVYERFLLAFNSCTARIVDSVSELVLCDRPWEARKGKESKMSTLKEIWEELSGLELFYTDEATYRKGLLAVQNKLMCF